MVAEISPEGDDEEDGGYELDFSDEEYSDSNVEDNEMSVGDEMEDEEVIPVVNNDDEMGNDISVVNNDDEVNSNLKYCIF